MRSYRRYTAAVVVLGDIGRSPRMCYHAYSLATELDYNVKLIGYLESTPHPLIHNNPCISYVAVAPPPDCLARLPEAVQLPLKFIWTFLFLSWALLFRVGWDVKLILMQNPPALPTMFVCWMVKTLSFSVFFTFLISNKYGMLIRTFPKVLKTKNNNVSVLQKPGACGRKADAGLCVTRAMREDMQKAWGVHAAVFYDRPLKFSLADKHELLLRLGLNENGQVFGAQPTEDVTRFSIRDPSTGQVRFRDDRPLLAISSTSWTPDEDFQILLDAVKKSPATRLPVIVLIITGRGPLKKYYVEKIKRMKIEFVHTLWLESEDYPLMIATADLGVSLHTSSSGLDLPMKVVDMFGAGIPVLAKRFNCIGELVQDGQNGHLFDTATDLFQQLYTLATGFPTHCKVSILLISLGNSALCKNAL
uniref:Glycos_transf_1 domain-containing protein n=1 Tax=Angiostrongylus cantonensis TaxID=6313 RepID=A0A0K0DJY6_ANGCA